MFIAIPLYDLYFCHVQPNVSIAWREAVKSYFHGISNFLKKRGFDFLNTVLISGKPGSIGLRSGLYGGKNRTIASCSNLQEEGDEATAKGFEKYDRKTRKRGRRGWRELF
jgi:hypothetical protein